MRCCKEATKMSSKDIETQQKVKGKQWPQYIAVVAASLSSFCLGLQYAWSSPSFPKLIADDNPLNITSDEASLATVILPVGDMLGAPLMAYLGDIIGRKNGILLIALPAFISWMMVAFAQNITVLCIGRFIAGIGDGFFFIVYPMYVGEVADPNVRGVLGCSLSLAMILGMVTMNAYAPCLSIKNAALIASLFPVLLVLSFIWMPETPYFYLMKGKYKEAKKSLRFLKRCDIEQDFQQLKKDVERQMSERGTWKDLLCIESNRKALLICLGIRTVQQVSGVSAWNLFTQTIFIEAGGNISPVIPSLIYLFMQLISTFFGSFLLKRYGRRPLFILSSFASGIILLIGGTFFYLKELTDFDTSSFSWIPILVMLSFICMYSIGMGNIPSIMLSELFSASIKGKALCIMCMYYAGCVSVTSKLFYILLETFGMYASFFTFGSALIVSVIFSYYFVPETKGKTLEEIQQDFKSNDVKKK